MIASVSKGVPVVEETGHRNPPLGTGGDPQEFPSACHVFPGDADPGEEISVPTLAPLVEKPHAAAVYQAGQMESPGGRRIQAAKASIDLWLCIDALGLCMLLDGQGSNGPMVQWSNGPMVQGSIFFAYVCRKQLSNLELLPSMMRVFLLPWQQRRELVTGEEGISFARTWYD